MERRRLSYCATTVTRTECNDSEPLTGEIAGIGIRMPMKNVIGALMSCKPYCKLIARPTAVSSVKPILTCKVMKVQLPDICEYTCIYIYIT